MRARVVVAVVLSGVLGACDSIPPAGSTLITDVPPEPPPPPDDATPPPFEAGPIDSGPTDALYTVVDADLSACATCDCSPQTSFCFAGASPREPVDAGPDAGPGPCSVNPGPTPAIGCNALPAACTATPSCGCILSVLQPQYRCYLNCRTDGSGFLVYCPHP
jgi:hypothetical protein